MVLERVNKNIDASEVDLITSPLSHLPFSGINQPRNIYINLKKVQISRVADLPEFNNSAPTYGASPHMSPTGLSTARASKGVSNPSEVSSASNVALLNAQLSSAKTPSNVGPLQGRSHSERSPMMADIDSSSTLNTETAKSSLDKSPMVREEEETIRTCRGSDSNNKISVSAHRVNELANDSPKASITKNLTSASGSCGGRLNAPDSHPLLLSDNRPHGNQEI